MLTDRYLTTEYLDANPTWHEERSDWKADQVLKGLEALGLKPSSIADVGCGAGAVIEILSRSLNVPSTGYEPSPVAFNLTRNRSGPRFVNGPIDAHHDLVTCLDVLEHIEDYFLFLRSLKPYGNTFIFHIPLDLNALAVLTPTGFTRRRKHTGHLHYFTRDTAIATLVECGYKVVHERYTASGWEGTGRGYKHLLKSVPRRLAGAVSKHAAVRLFGGCSLLVVAH